MTTSASLPPAPEISSEAATTDNSILFDMTTPEVSNEPISAGEPPATITRQTAIENVSTENAQEISQSPIDTFTTAEPVRINLPQVTTDTVPINQAITPADPLDMFSAGVQNNAFNNNKSEPIQMDLPEITSDTLNQTVTPTDSLDIFSAGVQNNEINNKEDSQPKQTTDDLGFLDAFG